MREVMERQSHYCRGASFNSEPCFQRNMKKRIQSQREIDRTERGLKSNTMKNGRMSGLFVLKKRSCRGPLKAFHRAKGAEGVYGSYCKACFKHLLAPSEW